MTPVRLKRAVLRSRVKYSTTTDMLTTRPEAQVVHGSASLILVTRLILWKLSKMLTIFFGRKSDILNSSVSRLIIAWIADEYLLEFVLNSNCAPLILYCLYI